MGYLLEDNLDKPLLADQNEMMDNLLSNNEPRSILVQFRVLR